MERRNFSAKIVKVGRNAKDWRKFGAWGAVEDKARIGREYVFGGG